MWSDVQAYLCMAVFASSINCRSSSSLLTLFSSLSAFLASFISVIFGLCSQDLLQLGLVCQPVKGHRPPLPFHSREADYFHLWMEQREVWENRSSPVIDSPFVDQITCGLEDMAFLSWYTTFFHCQYGYQVVETNVFHRSLRIVSVQLTLFVYILVWIMLGQAFQLSGPSADGSFSVASIHLTVADFSVRWSPSNKSLASYRPHSLECKLRTLKFHIRLYYAIVVAHLLPNLLHVTFLSLSDITTNIVS